MNKNQTEQIYLTLQLDLKVKEYKSLCEKLEILKKQNLNQNSLEYVELLKLFEKNYEEISQINEKLKKL